MVDYPERWEIDDDPSLDEAALLEMLRAMLEIRGLEDEIQRAFTKDLVRGSTHLCTGQEAAVVGACSVLRTTDSMVCTYRGHGAVLAKGASLAATFAEIVGRETGLCGGKGGSMHLTDAGVGAYGSFAIVGAHLPIANGLALAARQQGSDAVSLCFFGDGSTNIGAFHESLNLAAVWSLPVIFFCENNLYGEYTAWRATARVDRLADRAGSYGMPGVRIDGNDVIAVRRATGQAVERARAGEGPTLIEAVTYRHRGHSRTDPAKYRPDGELERWLKVDPIRRLENLLATRGVSPERLQEITAAARDAVRDAVEEALSAAPPRLEALYEDVYA
ncbi:thiamine pyrophosphate-dependent dehydrogenase E1 component subunit alpha [Rhizohabitans arisaemae]|uniref:thiamine pyrophosphate-dependent dehydrogenase E1 component subunit alpha n=1 Tax=Rhizohabitans arisaemae TaxID=2720610 RepID=UPI0024B15A26|nr:thiamine pyrophosphate-dependent dehydrogenase E1 component subunit alpha [Rhizohabitans arisaemae]